MEDGKSTESRLVDALLFGRLEGLPEESLILFSRAGLIHLFSASGFHLSAAVALARLFALPLHRGPVSSRRRRFGPFLVELLLLAFFAQSTGWSSPMVRAFVFQLLRSGSRILQLDADASWLFLLSLSCAAALGKGSSLSFLLSALGMAGVLHASRRGFLASLLYPWLFTLPVTLFSFGHFPLLAPLWNASFGFLLSWTVMPLAILSLLLRSLGLPSRLFDSAGERLLLHTMPLLEAAVRGLGCVYAVNPLRCAIAAAALGAVLALWRSSWRFASLLGGGAGLLLALLFPGPSLLLLDVGQGDAILLRGSGGGWDLQDTGPPSWGATAPVVRRIGQQGIGSLNELILSHLDQDHRGGLPSLLISTPVRGSLWLREELLQDKAAEEALAQAERAGIPLRFLSGRSAPPGWRCWLAPFPRKNEASPLCRVELPKGGSVLLTGDMGERAESWFLRTLQPFPTAEILKVAHHGSRYSSSTAFLQASGARLALVSVGARNRYGHPHPETLARIERAGLELRRSDREGTLGVYPGYFSLLREEITRFGVAASPAPR